MKSSPPTITSCPSIFPNPKIKFAGVRDSRLPSSSYSAPPATFPISSKDNAHFLIDKKGIEFSTKTENKNIQYQSVK